MEAVVQRRQYHMQLHNKIKIRKIAILEIHRIGELSRSEKMSNAGVGTRRNRQQILGLFIRSTEKQATVKIQQKKKEQDLTLNAKRGEKTKKGMSLQRRSISTKEEEKRGR